MHDNDTSLCILFFDSSIDTSPCTAHTGTNFPLLPSRTSPLKHARAQHLTYVHCCAPSIDVRASLNK